MDYFDEDPDSAYKDLDGDLTNLIDDFSDGRIQFAFVRVNDPNTSLPKFVLIAWCGEGVPERTKGYFTSHLATVSRILHVRPSSSSSSGRKRSGSDHR